MLGNSSFALNHFAKCLVNSVALLRVFQTRVGIGGHAKLPQDVQQLNEMVDAVGCSVIAVDVSVHEPRPFT